MASSDRGDENEGIPLVNSVANLPPSLFFPHPMSMNHLILENIFKYSNPQHAEKYRLVCSDWDDAILSLPTPKLELAKKYFQARMNGAVVIDNFDFQEILHTMHPELARKLVGHPIENHIIRCTRMFSETIQHIKLCSSNQQIPTIHQIFEFHLPNIKNIELHFYYRAALLNINIASPTAAIPIKKKLNTLKICPRKMLDQYDINDIDIEEDIDPIATISQLLVDAAPNLKDLELQYILPDLSRIKQLETLCYEYGSYYIDPNLTLVTPSRLSNVLGQVAPGLKHLRLGHWYGLEEFDIAAQREFLMPKMPKLETFANEDISLFHSGGVVEAVFGQGLKKVDLNGCHTPKSENLAAIVNSQFFKAPFLTDLSITTKCTCASSSVILGKLTKALFPTLQRLKFIMRRNSKNLNPLKDDSGVHLDVALNICHKLDLKDFHIQIPLPTKLSSFLKILSKHETLFSGKRLKVLVVEMNQVVEDDLEFWDIGLFGPLKSMSGMGIVKMRGLSLTPTTAQNMAKFIFANNLPIGIFEGMIITQARLN